MVDAVVEPEAALRDAAAELLAGGTVVLPTDTVYGLAARAADPEAVASLFERKARPADKRVAVLVTGTEQAHTLVRAGSRFDLLAGSLWPGPLTLVCPRAASFGAWLGEGDPTVAVRCPAHDLVRALAAEVGPLATTSANRSGGSTPTTAAGAAAAVGGDLLVLDGGSCEGSASTVVDLTRTPARILREGSILVADLAGAGVEALIE